MSDDTPDVATAVGPDATSDTLFDDVGHRAGAALRRPAPSDGPQTIAARRRSQRRVRATVAGGAVLVIAIGALLAVTRGDDASPLPPVDSTLPTAPTSTGPTPTTTTPSSTFRGASQPRGTEVRAESTWVDPLDAEERGVDVRQIAFSPGQPPFWTIDLAEKPPLASELEPGVVMAYGLVFDIDADGVADYEAGLATDAPSKGEFRVWVTNLATGATQEHAGPPYGFPMESRHPDDARPDDPPSMQTQVMLEFLPGSKPPGLSYDTVRFYAWASVTRNGQVTASDVAPDTGWIVAPDPDSFAP